MSINYDDISVARGLIISEIQSAFPGVPLSVEHYILAEHRLQSLILSGLLNFEEADETNVKISESIEERKSNS